MTMQNRKRAPQFVGPRWQELSFARECALQEASFHASLLECAENLSEEPETGPRSSPATKPRNPLNRQPRTLVPMEPRNSANLEPRTSPDVVPRNSSTVEPRISQTVEPQSSVAMEPQASEPEQPVLHFQEPAIPSLSVKESLPANNKLQAVEPVACEYAAPSPAKASPPLRPRLGVVAHIWSWLHARYALTATKRLRVAEMIPLGEKRFLAVVSLEGREFLIGGGASGVSVVTQLGMGREIADGPHKEFTFQGVSE